MGSIAQVDQLASCDEYAKMLRGELYYSFGPEMTAARRRCAVACAEFNATVGMSRRRMVEQWRKIIGDTTPLPPLAPTIEEDEALFTGTDPWVEGPIKVDYGIHLRVGPGSFINFNFTCLDSCQVTIGARVLFGPNVSIYTASHPIDPAVRMGVEGPECGNEIQIGDDCWIGGQVIILAGVVIGRGCTVGAGSVVTKSVEPFTVVAGNPAKVIKKLPNNFKK